MKTRIPCVQRVACLSAMSGNGHDVYQQDNIIARVSCSNGSHYLYFLYDEAQEQRVRTHIYRWDMQLNKMFSFESYFDFEPSEIYPLV